MRVGHAEKGRKGVYGLGSLWRIVWGMVIGVIGAVNVLLCVIEVKEGMNKLKEELSKVLRELSSLGSVNFRAEEEYGEYEERYRLKAYYKKEKTLKRKIYKRR